MIEKDDLTWKNQPTFPNHTKRDYMPSSLIEDRMYPNQLTMIKSEKSCISRMKTLPFFLFTPHKLEKYTNLHLDLAYANSSDALHPSVSKQILEIIRKYGKVCTK